MPPPMRYALSLDINWVTGTQEPRLHSPAFDLAVRCSDKVYQQNEVESRTKDMQSHQKNLVSPTYLQKMYSREIWLNSHQ